jgi:hypothetical protein
MSTQRGKKSKAKSQKPKVEIRELIKKGQH